MRHRSETKRGRTSLVLNEEELIKQVNLRPVLYDRSLKMYRRPSARKQTWEAISLAMNAPVEDCRRKWRSLRDSFTKHYKTQKRNSDTTVKHRKWIFYDNMKFLEPFLENTSVEVDGLLWDEYLDNSEDSHSVVCETVSRENPRQLGSAGQTENETREVLEEQIHIIDRNGISEQSNDIPLCVEASDAYTHPSIEAVDEPGNASLRHSSPAKRERNPILDERNTASVETPIDSYDDKNKHYCRRNNTVTFSPQCIQTSVEHDPFDSNEKFLLSCAVVMKRLTHRQNALARLKIQQILYDVEFGTS